MAIEEKATRNSGKKEAMSRLGGRGWNEIFRIGRGARPTRRTGHGTRNLSLARLFCLSILGVPAARCSLIRRLSIVSRLEPLKYPPTFPSRELFAKERTG